MYQTELVQDWRGYIIISFCVVTLLQVFYYLFFFSRLAFFNPKSKNISPAHPVSVIVCARDEAHNLIKNLPAILAQKYSATHEIIVVNDNSFDESKYILEEYQRTFKQLELVELKQEARYVPGKKFPLSVGINTARHEIVLLTDADCTPAGKHWIEKMLEGYQNNIEIVLGYGAYHKKKGFLNKLVRWETFHTALQYLSYARAGLPYMGVGRNLSYRKSIFFRHKGFSSHNHIASGDDDLFINIAATKNNTAIVIDQEAFTFSEPAKTWRQWVNQKSRHYSTGKYYRFLHKFLLGLYSLTHFVFYPLLIAGILFFDWKIALLVFCIRFLIQYFIFFKTMNKLDEKDLFPIFIVLDAWMFFYYLIFSFTIFKKPVNTWK